MTVISGYINSELVTSFVYDGEDAGLNHYYYKGKIYAGVVKYTYVVSSVKY